MHWLIDVSSLEDILLVLLHCPNKILNLRRKYLMWVVNIGRCIKRVREVSVWVWYGLCHQVAELCMALSESRKFHGSVIMWCTTCVINIRFPFAVFYCGSMFTNHISRLHDDVIKLKHFLRYWPFLRGIHRSPVNSPHKGLWRGALMSSLMTAL